MSLFKLFILLLHNAMLKKVFISAMHLSCIQGRQHGKLPICVQLSCCQTVLQNIQKRYNNPVRHIQVMPACEQSECR